MKFIGLFFSLQIIRGLANEASKDDKGVSLIPLVPDIPFSDDPECIPLGPTVLRDNKDNWGQNVLTDHCNWDFYVTPPRNGGDYASIPNSISTTDVNNNIILNDPISANNRKQALDKSFKHMCYNSTLQPKADCAEKLANIATRYHSCNCSLEILPATCQLIQVTYTFLSPLPEECEDVEERWKMACLRALCQQSVPDFEAYSCTEQTCSEETLQTYIYDELDNFTTPTLTEMEGATVTYRRLLNDLIEVKSKTGTAMTIDLGLVEAEKMMDALKLKNVKMVTLLFFGEKLAERIHTCLFGYCVDTEVFWAMVGGFIIIGILLFWLFWKFRVYLTCGYCGKQDEDDYYNDAKYSLIKPQKGHILGDNFKGEGTLFINKYL